MAGGNGAIFDHESIELIHERSAGIPRVINQLCDLCLVYAYAERSQQVNAAIVAEVFRDKSRNFAIRPPAPIAATNGAAERYTAEPLPEPSAEPSPEPSAEPVAVPRPAAKATARFAPDANPLNGSTATRSPIMTEASARVAAPPPAAKTPRTNGAAPRPPMTEQIPAPAVAPPPAAKAPLSNGAAARPPVMTDVPSPPVAPAVEAAPDPVRQQPSQVQRPNGAKQPKVWHLPLNIGVQPEAPPKKRHRGWFFFFVGCIFAVCGTLPTGLSQAEGLTAARLGVIYNLDDVASQQVALEYAGLLRACRPKTSSEFTFRLSPSYRPPSFAPIRTRLIADLPTTVQALLLVWSKPFAVGCMSITTAFAAGYDASFCVPGCSRTQASPLFDSDGWLPADTLGWFPAMLLPSDDEDLARKLIQRGIAADSSAVQGTLYLIRTRDTARNVRAATYDDATLMLENRVRVAQWSAPITRDVPEAIGYFTGAARVEEMPRIQFIPGALADHLTSTGGVLEGGHQMSAVSWLKQGATATYGSVSEPCSFPEKFPNVSVLFEHYVHGETALEAYWKSVAMPGQGLILGEPLARPFATRR